MTETVERAWVEGQLATSGAWIPLYGPFPTGQAKAMRNILLDAEPTPGSRWAKVFTAEGLDSYEDFRIGGHETVKLGVSTARPVRFVTSNRKVAPESTGPKRKILSETTPVRIKKKKSKK